MPEYDVASVEITMSLVTTGGGTPSHYRLRVERLRDHEVLAEITVDLADAALFMSGQSVKVGGRFLKEA